MAEPDVIHSTFTIQREYPVSRALVFAALSEPGLKRRWFADGGQTSTVEEFTMDFRVGGTDVTSFRAGGVADSEHCGDESHHISGHCAGGASGAGVHDEHGGAAVWASMATIELRATAAGTLLVFTEQGRTFRIRTGRRSGSRGGWFCWRSWRAYWVNADGQGGLAPSENLVRRAV